MKTQRHAALLEIIRHHRVGSQEDLRRILRRHGFDVTQATLSRDIRELGLAKVSDPEHGSYYRLPSDGGAVTPSLEQLLPLTLVSVAGVGHLLVLKTAAGAAQALAQALDRTDWPDVLGTIAGDDTILVVVQGAAARDTLTRQLRALAGLTGIG